MQNDPYNPMNPILAFTPDEAMQVQTLLETLVRSLRIVPGGGKIEEGYWSYIYHTVRGAPLPSWSNLPMRDFLHNGLGVEMKLLQVISPGAAQGRRIMHPSATRTLSFDPKGSYLFNVPNDGRKPVWLTEEVFNALQDALTKRNQSVDEWIISVLENSRE